MNSSLPTRLLFPVVMIALGGILLLVVAGALWTIHSNEGILEDYREREGHLMTEGLAYAVAPELVEKNYGEIESRLMQTVSSQNVRSALVIDMQGQVLSYVVSGGGDALPHPEFTLHHVVPPANADHLVEQSHPGFLAVWHIIKAGTAIGWVRLEIGNEYYAAYMGKMKRDTWILALVVALLGGVMLTAAIMRSHRLLREHEIEVEDTRRVLEDKANYDALTGLPNRSLLQDRLAQAVARNTRARHLLAVCFVDLDNFKPINDRYGHVAGDRVLIKVARRLGDSVRGGDTVARIGGDEFVTLLGDLKDEREAGLAVERLLQSLQDPMMVEGRDLHIRASIGYVLHPGDCADPSRLVTLADQAMYQVKNLGGGSIQRYRSAGNAAAKPQSVALAGPAGRQGPTSPG